jgi:hypothetical protein
MDDLSGIITAPPALADAGRLLLKMAIVDSDTNKYFPDNMDTLKNFNRSFMYTVVFHVKPSLMEASDTKSLGSYCRKQMEICKPLLEKTDRSA